jgi:hypothetical protein
MKTPQISNFMKMQPVEAKLLHADRQTDMRKLTVATHNVANIPNKNVHFVCVYIHFSYNNNTHKLKVFHFFLSYEVSGAAVELFNRTK